MALLVAEYDALMEAKSQNEWLMEQLRLLKKKQSGASSEQTKEPLDGQMSLLFNEAEAYTAPPGPQKTTQVPAHTRKQSGSVKDAVPDNIPVEVVEHRLPEEERVCPQCGERMREIGTGVRETLKLIPAKAILRKDVYYTCGAGPGVKSCVSEIRQRQEEVRWKGRRRRAESLGHRGSRRAGRYTHRRCECRPACRDILQPGISRQRVRRT